MALGNTSASTAHSQNLKALKGSPEQRALTERYTQQLAGQQTQLESLEKQATDLQAREDAAQPGLNQMIQNLSLDETLWLRAAGTELSWLPFRI